MMLERDPSLLEDTSKTCQGHIGGEAGAAASAHGVKCWRRLPAGLPAGALHACQSYVGRGAGAAAPVHG